MTRYAIFSDVHGNLEALEAFLRHSREQGAEEYLCCGDIVGYGADPAACLDRVRELCPGRVALGNHDQAVATGDATRMNPHALRAALWTFTQLSPAQREWLDGLPLRVEVEPEILLVHSSPDRPERWDYLFGLQEAQALAETLDRRSCFLGHTHVPFAFELTPEGAVIRITSRHVHLRRDSRYLINVGSVGQPRDRDPRGSYVLYDTGREVLERFRFSYDIEKAQRKIIEAGLPDFLALRLEGGY